MAGSIQKPKNTSITQYPEVHPALLGVFLIFVIFKYLQGGYRVPWLGEIRFELIVGALLTVFAIPAYLSIKQRQPSSVIPWAIGLLLMMVLSVPFSIDPAFSWNVFVDRGFKFALVGVFIAAFVTSPRALRWFLLIFLLAFLKMAEEGVVGSITGSMIWENQGVPRLHGSTPNYFHPNSFSGTQLATLPFAVELFIISQWRLRYLLAVQILMAATVIVFCGSRTAYVAGVIWIVMRSLQSRKKLKGVTVLLVAGVIAINFIPEEYIGRFESAITQTDKEGASIDTRKEILRDAWELTLRHPLGIGAGAFPIARMEAFGRIQDTHNLYLEITTNLGFLGLLVFAGLIIAMLRSLSRSRDSLDQDIKLLSNHISHLPAAAEIHNSIAAHLVDLRLLSASCRALGAFIVIRLLLGLFGHDLYEIYWWFAAGLTVALQQLGNTATIKTRTLYPASQTSSQISPGHTNRPIPLAY